MPEYDYAQGVRPDSVERAYLDRINAQQANVQGRYYGSPEAQEIALMRATPLSTLQNQFFNLPAYRLAYGSSPEMLDPTLDPTERFRFDPGYQFQQDEGMRQLMRGHAAQGLLESGRSIRDAQQFSQNLADQQYGRFQAQNQGLFADYQNRLQGLMNMGLGTTGAQSAGELGSNLGNLFANQGVFGGSGMLNTGAAQSSNLMNAASIGAQIASANAAAGFGGGDTGAGSLGQSSSGVGGYF